MANDSVQETTATTGTGTWSLAGASTGHRSFATFVPSGAQCYYHATDGVNTEDGIGTFTSGTTNTLSRDTVITSSTGGAKINYASTVTLTLGALPTGYPGTVTSIATTAPIAGGTITSTGTISITGAAGKVLAGASPAFTATPTLGIATSLLGTLSLCGNTSGTVLVTPQAAAGTPTLTLPNASGTFAISATSPLALSATTGNLSLGTNIGLVGVQRITATGAYTYTPTSGTNFVVVELQGAGGGSSGIAQPTAGKMSLGRAGGGGAWVRVKLTANFSGATGSVGAKGTGGSSGDNAGNNGGDTTFITTAAVTYTAGGGVGGNNGGSALASFPTFSNAVAGGTATGGDDNRDGMISYVGFGLTSVFALGGTGGSSPYSAGGAGTSIATANTTAAGSAATGKGGGGGAPSATGTGAAQAGANGSDGMVIIWEYR